MREIIAVMNTTQAVVKIKRGKNFRLVQDLNP